MNKIMQQPPMEVPRPPGKEMEDGLRPESNFRGISDVQKWKKEDWMKKGVLVLVLRVCALVFSFIAFILMAVVPGFHLNDALSYVFSIAVITMVYTAIQVGIKGDELRTGREVISPEIAVWIDFIGDQIVAYLLISSASIGGYVVNSMRVAAGYQSYPVLDQATAAVALSFMAFFAVAPASLISGYHLFTELSRS